MQRSQTENDFQDLRQQETKKLTFKLTHEQYCDINDLEDLKTQLQSNMEFMKKV